MMNEILIWIFALLSGMLLGLFFFGGLWWTTRKVLFTQRPALWMLTSMLLRMSVTLTGFYFVASDDVKRLLICLLGFFLARLTITRLTRLSEEKQIHPIQENTHAS